ncbi:MAG TPA: hypothetical protein VM490_21030 [Armatimonadaceae bacterium]|nr:hypothetical protein [Armatimonadaceae bacterium]
MSHASTSRAAAATAAAVAAAAAGMSLLAGCSQGMPNGGPDVAMVREVAASSQVKMPDRAGAIFPLTPGRTLKMRVTRGGADGGVVPGEVRVVGVRTLAGRTGTLVESVRGGKRFRLELYGTDGDGKTIRLKALGESPERMLVFDPPIPVLKSGSATGADLLWNGTARMGKAQYSARAYHRVSAHVPVKTPSGEYKAFRLDSIISVTANRQRIDYPAVMWLAPEVGMVQRRLAERNRPVEEHLAERPR